jgi:hypothetical protein
MTSLRSYGCAAKESGGEAPGATSAAFWRRPDYNQRLAHRRPRAPKARAPANSTRISAPRLAARLTATTIHPGRIRRHPHPLVAGVAFAHRPEVVVPERAVARLVQLRRPRQAGVPVSRFGERLTERRRVGVIARRLQRFDADEQSIVRSEREGVRRSTSFSLRRSLTGPHDASSALRRPRIGFG